MSKIDITHGAGTQNSRDLIKNLFVKHFNNKILAELDDSAELKTSAKRLAFTTDSYVVSPVEFPDTNIGQLAVCGTVNDLAMKGAKAKYISASVILEEGFDIKLLEKIVKTMAQACKEAGVQIVTGDTKVVEKGQADKIFINTSGVGEIYDKAKVSSKNVKNGDVLIVNGNLAEHGVAVLNARHNLGIKSNIKSDANPLNLITDKLKKFHPHIHCMRDLTRGGLLASLVEISEASKCTIEINQNDLPISEQVKSACEILGLDPLSIANEGKFICVVPQNFASRVLVEIKKHKYGKDAKIIGKVLSKKQSKVFLQTEIGTKRVLKLSEGENLPRIC